MAIEQTRAAIEKAGELGMSGEYRTEAEDRPMNRDEHSVTAPAPLTPLDDILDRMNDLGCFQVSVLASTEGLPIATARSRGDPEATAAIVALLQSVSTQAREQLGMGELDVVTVVARDHMRLACRYFSADGEELILAVMVEPGGYHRSATGWAIREIEALWNRRHQRKRHRTFGP
jgi:predicted regulator of Ras-like GTPase activity (Roadblock/LC7/MglB family)